MLGCSYGRLFQVAIAGGSYQEGLTVHIQGVPPGLLITEEEIYRDLLLRKPGQGELTSPRREPDVPVIYSGVNAADTMPGFNNKGRTNGTPFVILIPNLDRHFEHIEQYQLTNRTPRPGHASYASYQKYGEWDDAIGAGFFSGRYTSTIVAAGVVAKRILKEHGIEVFGYVKEAAGVRAPDVDLLTAKQKVETFKEIRRRHDVIYDWVFGEKRITPDMRFLQKMAVLAELEQRLIQIRAESKPMDIDAVRKEYGIHPLLNCPDPDAAEEMYKKIIEIRDQGDSSGGLVEIVALGMPVGVGEPMFSKLDGELGRMMSIGTIKAVEIGAGYAVKDMTGSQCNDQMRVENGKVVFKSNHAGGITGGLTTGQPIVARLAVKPTPTIAKDQETIDKVSLENATLRAVTRRDPTIVARVWPVAEAFMAIVLLDQYMMHLGYRALWAK
ncbi:MAG TPA: chorismate synthase [Candidatus Hydrogenedentes bacterium]|nr:chorismate synthase [Candidatus Hydrogenedentota bacterium]HOL76287.1 chorismate synthase [Candidatus Hydrogenedentota bacterium]HPO86114.1 chorismate synthase [Candidatus Hydrogenedentota bacterium]